MKSTTAIVALAAAVHASPLSKRQDNKVPDVWENKDTLCKGWVLNTPEEADTLWTMKTKAGDHLDYFLREQWEHQNNWLINLEDRVYAGTDGKSGAAGCSGLDHECSPMNNMECTEQYEKFGTDDPLSKTSYWIFQAAKGMHSKFKALKTKITEKTIISSLRIGQMVSDFGGNEDDTGDMVKWLASASAIGGALSGLSANPGFGVGLYLFGGIFSAFGNLKQEEIDQGSISAGLADLFEAAVDRLDETMRIVMGGGTEEQYNALKTSNPDPYKLPVANFFNGGFFLLNDNSEAVQLALNSVYGNIQPKVANNVMKAAQFHLVADKRRTSREDCGYETGRQWMALREGEEYCFYIMRHDPKPNRVGDWAEVSGEVYDKMASYGLGNREVYYRAILDCALSPNDNVDLGSLVGGEIPTCYFDLPAVYVDKDREVGCGDPFSTAECDYISATKIE
ncbi:uncharacterized protein FFUJ_05456 [Fusarium fujikuroi IMI 58289]|uniref:Uncharacterized protein n=1 Tax=Gibberella fujikuroi (strain CBS 195.34 / IMI 58289 / NRRL A-6831) TaxID=1279085 RepID=S0E4J4_GIBF5|nr:uncharacterized protein FFUJ_05456 [Fusarium fujikuroi IMI 58289]CCT69560.1 uncharacterized protein FFUJ_05456 [Fusarium fujikuroi IMI 58289]SCO26589.1 uncharacterized protein FFM5_14858 [Fusarium fujikuroi]SCO50193.1 uncharacterized protein FFMR_10171 [Fusarium fujikuroi]